MTSHQGSFVPEGELHGDVCLSSHGGQVLNVEHKPALDNPCGLVPDLLDSVVRPFDHSVSKVRRLFPDDEESRATVIDQGVHFGVPPVGTTSLQCGRAPHKSPLNQLRSSFVVYRNRTLMRWRFMPVRYHNNSNSAAVPPVPAADSGASVPPVADAPHSFTLPVVAAVTDSRGETAGGVARSPAKHRALTTFSDRLNRFLPLVSLDVSHEETLPGSVHRAHSPALSHNTQGACAS